MKHHIRSWCIAVGCLVSSIPATGRAQEVSRTSGDSVSFRFIESDLRAVASGLAPYLGKTLLQSGVPGTRVTLETPFPVPRRDVPGLLRGLAESNGLEFIEDSLSYRLRPRVAEPAATTIQSGEPQALHVIRLRHARAVEVANTVNLLYGNGAEFSGRTGLGQQSLTAQLRTMAPQPRDPAASTGSGSGALTGSVTIVPDELTNALLVRAGTADLALITSAVEQLDVRPLQVLIEVLIVEARTDRSFSLGAAVTVPPQQVGGGTASGTTRGPSGLGDVVISLMNMGRGDVSAVITAAQSKGEVEILSRPLLIAANNTQAHFMVGSQRPFISSSRQLPTDQPQADQVTSYRDVGTKLTVVPTINYDGYVALEILQEISAATDETQFNAPIISTREAHTQLLVKDGQTIVIGGLRDRQRDKGSRGVPLLSSLPLLGGFFGAATRRTVETELFIFMTPRVLRTDEDIDRATTARLPEQAKELP